MGRPEGGLVEAAQGRTEAGGVNHTAKDEGTEGGQDPSCEDGEDLKRPTAGRPCGGREVVREGLRGGGGAAMMADWDGQLGEWFDVE